MKKIFPLILLLIFCYSVSTAQSVKKNKDLLGHWNFDAPYAPEGYTSGTIDIGFAEKEYTATISLTNMGYSLTGEKIRVQNDSLNFMVWIESDSVSVALKINDKSTMTGNAVFSEGTIPLTLTKELKNK